MADQPDPAAPQKPSHNVPDITHDGPQEANPYRVRATKVRKPRQTTPEARQRQLEAAAANNVARSLKQIKFRNTQVAKWQALKAMEPNMTFKDAAKRLGLNVATLRGYVYQATREGFVKFDDSLQRLEYEIIPKVIDNLKEFVDKKDRTVTLETAKGTVFKQFQAAQGIQENTNMVLALKIETQPNEEPRTIAGVIVGTPKGIEE